VAMTWPKGQQSGQGVSLPGREEFSPKPQGKTRLVGSSGDTYPSRALGRKGELEKQEKGTALCLAFRLRHSAGPAPAGQPRARSKLSSLLPPRSLPGSLHPASPPFLHPQGAQPHLVAPQEGQPGPGQDSPVLRPKMLQPPA
jgi:hypothetical protein